MPWHHPNRSIRTSKIIKMDDDLNYTSFNSLMNRSGLISGYHKMSRRMISGNDSYEIPGMNTLRFDVNQSNNIHIKRHLLKTRGLSSITRSINKEAQTAISLINNYERRKSQTNSKVESVDLSKLIKETSIGLKTALYDLAKALNDFHPKELTASSSHEIEITAKVPFLAKIKLSEMKPPLILYISYFDDNRDCALYHSFTNVDPNENDCAGYHKNPSKVIIFEATKLEFDSKYIYLSFNSTRGAILRVLPKFKRTDKFSLSIISQQNKSAILTAEEKFDTKITDDMIGHIQDVKQNAFHHSNVNNLSKYLHRHHA